MPVRIVLADDHEIVRQGFRALIERGKGLEVVGEAANGRDAVEQVLRLKPDVAVLDIGLPQLNGVDAARQIAAQRPRCKIIALSIHQERRYVTEMLKAGAVGYLVKTCAADELTQAIEAVCAGEMYLSSKIAGSVVEQILRSEQMETSGAGGSLSAREREVLQLLVEGKSSKEIAHVIDVATRTVDLHRQNIMKKLDLYSVAELTKYAIREGITPLE
jgi:DNA-binding NarL/FixJ family response regulator